MPWKNGQGVTEEIQIEPEGTRFPKEPFLWRYSSATIHSRNSFSLFPGFDRLLAVWQGEGLLLNGKRLLPMNPFFFSGETEIDCELLGKEVIDVGLVFRRDLYSATMSVQSFSKEEKWTTEAPTTFFFVAEGEMSFDGQKAEIGDSFRIDGSASVDLQPLENCRCLVFQIFQRNS